MFREDSMFFEWREMKKMVNIKFLLPYLGILLASFLILSPIFRPGFLVYLDNAVHITAIHFVREHMIPEFHWITGWSQRDAGYPLLLEAHQFGFWGIAFLNMISGLSIEFLYKIALVISLSFPACALYFLLKSRYGDKPAFFTAILFLFQTEVFMTSIGGMWEQYLSLGFLILFIHTLDRFFYETTFKKATLLGILFALTIVSHAYSALSAFFLLLIVFIFFILSKRPLKEHILVFWIVILGAILSSYYSIPVIYAFLHASNPGGTSCNCLLVDNIIKPKSIFFLFFNQFTYLFLPGFRFNHFTGDPFIFLKTNGYWVLINVAEIILGLASLAGIIYFLKNRDKGKNYFLEIILIFCIMISVLSTGLFYNIPSIPLIMKALLTFSTYRYLIYLRIGLLIFACYGISKYWAGDKISLSLAPKPKFFKSLIETLLNFLIRYKKIIAILCIIALLLSFGIRYDTKYLECMHTSETAPIVNDCKDIWDWVKNNVDGSKTRVFYQDLYGNIQGQPYYVANSHLFGASEYYTGVWSLGGSCSDSYWSTQQRLFGKRIEDITDEELAENLKKYNCKYIVSVEPKLEAQLERSDLFERQHTINDFSIFCLKEYEPSWIEFSDNKTSYEIIRVNEYEWDIKVNNTARENTMLVKTRYHPYWSAYINGEEIPIRRSSEELINVKIADTGCYKLKLRYNPLFRSLFIRGYR